MVTPVTEIAYITLKPDTDISGSSDAARAWKGGLSVIAKQEGYQGSSYGRAVESPDVLMWFIDWDSKESHIKFAQSPAYEPFKENLSALMTAVHFHHVAFSPFPPKIVTRAPVIEFATFLDTKPHFLSNVEKFMKGIGTPDECYGSAWGDSVETDVGKHSDGSVKGKATVLLIGWESKEAHMRFRESDVFEKNIGLLREGMGGVEMFHIPFTAA
ncbi:hypothetical protein IFR04_000445 [Cadophora malorum]|uniref:ABM domain-containing protein n=1 Tax=Cadophora malorum TaxID=108018 RepID=A0A8H8BWT3_9HELO|nr:hypothetical protein IFR04_000445 [Cadophora malorum]